MRSRLILLVLAFGIGPPLLTGCGAGPAPAPAPPAEPGPSAAAQVTIDNFCYGPAELTVAVGTRVTWLNRDDLPHTVTSSATPRDFDSGALDTDQKFEHVFDRPGVYEYFCALHPKMTARVTVR